MMWTTITPSPVSPSRTPGLLPDQPRAFWGKPGIVNVVRNPAAWLVMIFWLVLGVSGAVAQETLLRGHVEDENGLPVEGAEIVILSPDELVQTAC